MALMRKLHVLSRTFLKTSSSRSIVTCDVNRPIFLARGASTTQPLCKEEVVKVTFIKGSGERIEAKGKVGDSLLDIVVDNDLNLDGFGACEGTCACSTCHLIISQQIYDILPDEPSTDEIDMLDLAPDLTPTSRLGCQIRLTSELDGMEVQVPRTTNDLRSANS